MYVNVMSYCLGANSQQKLIQSSADPKPSVLESDLRSSGFSWVFLYHKMDKDGTISKLALVVPKKQWPSKIYYHYLRHVAVVCRNDFVEWILKVSILQSLRSCQVFLRTLVSMTLIWMEMAISPKKSLIRPGLLDFSSHVKQVADQSLNFKFI